MQCWSALGISAIISSFFVSFFFGKETVGPGWSERIYLFIYIYIKIFYIAITSGSPANHKFVAYIYLFFHAGFTRANSFLKLLFHLWKHGTIFMKNQFCYLSMLKEKHATVIIIGCDLQDNGIVSWYAKNVNLLNNSPNSWSMMTPQSILCSSEVYSNMMMSD